MRPTSEVDSLETRLLLDGILAKYGYDFHQYEQSAIEQRVRSAVMAKKLQTVSRFTEKILRDEVFFQKFLETFSPHGSCLFEDTVFFDKVRTDVIPFLRTYPSVRVWHVGANPPELYSLAILLEEGGLGGRYKIYATDISTDALDHAKSGLLLKEAVERSEAFYRQAGGQEDFFQYFKSSAGKSKIDKRLKKNVLFFHYNPSTDGSPNEFHFILCRGLLDEFGPPLKERVFQLFFESLCPLGILALDSGANRHEMELARRYSPVDETVGIYQRAG